MGSKTGTSTTTVSKLPPYVEPYVTTYLAGASALSKTVFDLYWEDPLNLPTYAAQDASELAGIAALAARGASGNLTITKGISLVTDIINGIYLLGTDAFFQAMLSKFQDQFSDSFTSRVIPIIGVSPMRIGPTSADNLAVALCSNTISKFSGWKQAKMYFDNYRSGRTDQHQGMEYGIEHASQAYRNAEVLRAAGLYSREWLQGSYKDLYDKFVSVQAFKIERLEILGNAIRALVGTHTSRTQPFYGPSPAVALIGGAVAGAGMAMAAGSALTAAGYGAAGASVGGPWGIAAGAVIGGIVGLLSSQ